MSDGTKALRLPPGEMRGTAAELGRLSGDTDEAWQQLRHSWNRLDGGWEWYAAEDINGYYGRAMDMMDRMAAVLREMGEALVKTADLIEAADLAAVAFFEPDLAKGSDSRIAGLSAILSRAAGLNLSSDGQVLWEFTLSQDDLTLYKDYIDWLVGKLSRVAAILAIPGAFVTLGGIILDVGGILVSAIPGGQVLGPIIAGVGVVVTIGGLTLEIPSATLGYVASELSNAKTYLEIAIDTAARQSEGQEVTVTVRQDEGGIMIYAGEAEEGVFLGAEAAWIFYEIFKHPEKVSPYDAGIPPINWDVDEKWPWYDMITGRYNTFRRWLNPFPFVGIPLPPPPPLLPPISLTVEKEDYPFLPFPVPDLEPFPLVPITIGWPRSK